jgi:hypothetical protein
MDLPIDFAEFVLYNTGVNAMRTHNGRIRRRWATRIRIDELDGTNIS